MRLGPDVLVEIVSIVQHGLLGQVDVSDALRKVDLVDRDGVLGLSSDYLLEQGRITRFANDEWSDDEK